MYIFTENNNTKNGKIKKEGKKELSRTQTWHLWIDATTPNHYTTPQRLITKTWGKVFNLPLCLFHETSAGKMIKPHEQY